MKIKIVGSPLFLSTDSEVDAAQDEIRVRFPEGYRDYVTRFGEGLLGGSFVRIYPPHRILSGQNCVAEWRERVAEFWFWDAGSDVLSKEDAGDCIIIGDTMEGDELVIHPRDSEEILMLPRHSDRVIRAGRGLYPALDKLCSSRGLMNRFRTPKFEPFDSSAEEGAE